MLKIFDDREDNDAFIAWKESNKTFGFYLNLTTNSTAVLHKAPCVHFWVKGGSNTENKKICSIIKSELLDWAKANGAEITECKRCWPVAPSTCRV